MEGNARTGMSAWAGAVLGACAGVGLTAMALALMTVTSGLAEVRRDVAALEARWEREPVQVGDATLREVEASRERFLEAGVEAPGPDARGCAPGLAPAQGGGRTQARSMSAQQWLAGARR